MPVGQENDELADLMGSGFVGDLNSSHRRKPSLLRFPEPVLSHYAADEYEYFTSETARSSVFDHGEHGGHFPVPGSPRFTGDSVHSQQHKIPVSQVFELDEDLNVEFIGYRRDPLKVFVYRVFCFITCGIVFLFCRWFPQLHLRLTCKISPLRDATFIFARNEWNQQEIIKVQKEYVGPQLAHLFRHGAGSAMFSSAVSYDSDNALLHKNLHKFSYRCLTFVLNPLNDTFVDHSTWRDGEERSYEEFVEGLDRERLLHLRSVFGSNSIQIPAKSTWQLLVDEILNPFFLFQTFSIILWCFERYYYYAACIVIIMTVSTIMTLQESKRNIARLREISHFECEINVRRNGVWRSISSDDLLPGDIYEIVDDTAHFPCDSILVTGDCIVNESMLTGESVPVFKIAAQPSELPMAFSNTDLNYRYFLFGGTEIIRYRPPINSETGQKSPCLAIAVKTGFTTTKGGLIRSMLFPKPNKFKFYRDSFKFLGVMAGFALIGFVLSLIWLIRNGVDVGLIFLRSLDLITIIIPPALPAAMSVGTSFALNRLKKNQIFCISPPRINICGKVNLFVFDKTGTLTEDGLDIHGIRPMDINYGQLQSMVTDVDELDFEDTSCLNVLGGLAACHSLKSLSGELIGDPMDLKMFEFTKWELEEPHGSVDTIPTIVRPRTKTGYSNSLLGESHRKKSLNIDAEETAVRSNCRKQIGIVKCFEFASSLRRMSVITKSIDDNVVATYCKGAPEVIVEICRPDSVPENFNDALAEYVHDGYRVLAIAGKRLEVGDLRSLQKFEREDVETDLHFLGFIIYENKLKKESAPVLHVLEKARIKTLMCTGDNLLTAVCVARECKMIDQSHVYYPSFIESNVGSQHTVVWKCLDDPRLYLDPRTLEPMDDINLQYVESQSNSSQLSPNLGVEEHISLKRSTNRYSEVRPDLEAARYSRSRPNYNLALTGDVFAYILSNASQDTIGRILVKARVFARMSPDQKLDLVERLQNINYCVGMCGDGANDCGALSAADVGISLSEAEASVAAPFTSRVSNIECVLRLIREGRAALVTSFSCFKYIALYSFIQFCTVTLMYVECRNLGDFQFLYIDLLLILPIAVVMGRTRAAKKIHHKHPTATLVSKTVLTSMIGQIFIAVSFQIGIYAWIYYQSADPLTCEYDVALPTHENTVVFLFSTFQYIWAAIVFSVGYPYRASMFQNGMFVGLIVTLLFLNVFITSVFGEVSAHVLELQSISGYERFSILLLALINFACMLLGERYVFPALSKVIGRILYTKSQRAFDLTCGQILWDIVSKCTWQRKKKPRKQYKVIQYQYQHR